MNSDLDALLTSVRDNPNDPFLREVAADKMEEVHGHRLIEPFIPMWPQLPGPCVWCRGTGHVHLLGNPVVRGKEPLRCTPCRGRGIGARFFGEDSGEAFVKAVDQLRDEINASFRVPLDVLRGDSSYSSLSGGPASVTFGGQKLRVKDWKIEPAPRSKPRKIRGKKRGK